MRRIINTDYFDYTKIVNEETGSYVSIKIEYGESLDGITFQIKETDLVIDKDNESGYAKIQEIVNNKVEEFKNGYLLD